MNLFWLNASRFPYHNEFHAPGMIIDQKPDMTLGLSQDIDKISCLNVMMKTFSEVVLGQAIMSPHWLCMGFVHSLFVRGPGTPLFCC